MKKPNEKVAITLLCNEEEKYVMALDVNGVCYEREEEENFKDFLARAIWEHQKSTGVNILPYFQKDENIYAKRKTNYMQEQDLKEKEANALKTARKKMATKAAAVVVGAGLAVGTSVGCTNLDKKSTQEDKTKTKTEQAQETKDLASKSTDELISMLNKRSGQQEVLKNIVETEEYFNYAAGPTVKEKEDGDAQLFLTADEVISAYIYANLSSIGSEKMSKMFGQSNVIWINKGKIDEEPVYEPLNKDQIENSFESLAETLANYYVRGTEPTGITNIFENVDEQEFYADFEQLVLEYNRTGSEDVKDEIRANLKAIFGTPGIDKLYEKYPGASAIIARSLVPALHANEVVCDQGLSEVTNIYNCEIKNILNDQADQMFIRTKCVEKTNNDNILSEIYKKVNKPLIGKNRNIYNCIDLPSKCLTTCNVNCEEPQKTCEEPQNEDEVAPVTRGSNPITRNDKPTKKDTQKKKKKCKHYRIKKADIPAYKDDFVNRTTKTVTEKTTRDVTTDRSKVEEYFTEKEIKDAERKADDNCNKIIKKKNQEEDKIMMQLMISLIIMVKKEHLILAEVKIM